MKYLKKFESNNEPDINDYVICYDNYVGKRDILFDKFISKSVGIIDDIIIEKDEVIYLIEFEEQPPSSYVDFFSLPIKFKREDIIYWSKDKEELKNMIKYNL